MIDFENVRNAGFAGVECIQSRDCIILFYSEAAKTIEKGIMNSIQRSGCSFEACRLVNCGKNALDFYISSRIGELIGAGFSGQIAIVSRDQGFYAVRDYWQHCGVRRQNIIIQPSIEKCILTADEKNTRTQYLQQKTRMVDISAEYARLKERRRLQGILQSVLGNSEYNEYIDEIQELMEKGKDRKIIYINTLRHFGRKNGLELYRKIKEDIYDTDE